MKFESFGTCFPNSKILVSFHGLPGLRNDRNRDFLKKLAKDKDIFCILIPLQNLSSNSFSFFRETFQAIETLCELTKLYPSHQWQVLGHSWGALVALIALSKKIISPEKVCFLSPYTMFPQNDSVLMESLEGLQKAYPLLLDAQKEPRFFVKEIRDLEKLLEPKTLSINLEKHTRLYVLQASDDQEVSAQSTKNFLKSCDCEILYKEFQTDHSFIQNREEIYKELRGFFDA